MNKKIQSHLHCKHCGNLLKELYATKNAYRDNEDWFKVLLCEDVKCHTLSTWRADVGLYEMARADDLAYHKKKLEESEGEAERYQIRAVFFTTLFIIVSIIVLGMLLNESLCPCF